MLTFHKECSVSGFFFSFRGTSKARVTWRTRRDLSLVVSNMVILPIGDALDVDWRTRGVVATRHSVSLQFSRCPRRFRRRKKKPIVVDGI